MVAFDRNHDTLLILCFGQIGITVNQERDIKGLIIYLQTASKENKNKNIVFGCYHFILILFSFIQQNILL